MKRSPLALAAAIICAVTAYASGAEAGFRVHLGFGGPLPGFTAYGNSYHGAREYHRERYVARHTVKKPKTHVARSETAKKKAEPEPKVAKKRQREQVAAKPAPKKVAPVAKAPVADPSDTENSSIATASLDGSHSGDTPSATEDAKAVDVQVPEPKPTTKPEKTASKLDCKKFFPSVGMTLTVPCE